MTIKFRKDGTVESGLTGIKAGKVRRDGDSRSAYINPWVFESWDNQVSNAQTRKALEHDILNAIFRRRAFLKSEE